MTEPQLPFPESDESLITARILGLAYGGEMVGTIESEYQESEGSLRGKKVFVRGAIPGELVQLSDLADKDSYSRASLRKVIEASPHRVAPPCPYFGDCGGCDLQHIDLKAQRELKRQMVESMLSRQAKVTPRQGVVLAGSDLPGYHYRSRLALHLGEDGTLGLFRLGSNEVVDIKYCYLAYAALNTGLAALKHALRPFGKLFRSILLEDWDGRLFAVLKTREIVHTELIIWSPPGDVSCMKPSPNHGMTSFEISERKTRSRLMRSRTISPGRSSVIVSTIGSHSIE